MASIAGFTQTSLSDHEFAAWLRKKGWDCTWHHVQNVTYYHGPKKGDIVAITHVDNTKNTKLIFLQN